jgi:cytoskeleton protein RodZ
MQTPVELDRLQLSFTAECWLEVSDAQGDVLATELQRPGSQLSLLGRAPFQVTLGYPSAAAIKLNGVSVTIPSPSGASNVVNLTVGAN